MTGRGMVLDGATSASAGALAPAWLSCQSSHQFFSRRTESKSALIPSCLCFPVPSCPYGASSQRNFQTPFLPSSLYSLPLSWSRSSCVGFGRFGGKFVHDLRKPATGRSPKVGSTARSMGGQSEKVLEDIIQSKNSLNPVVVYSKSWCPYCSMVKALFTKLRVSFEVVELDQLVDEQDVQEALKRLTGQGTVPNVFIGGKHIGGCDDTMALHRRGELVLALEAAGVRVAAT